MCRSPERMNHVSFAGRYFSDFKWLPFLVSSPQRLLACGDKTATESKSIMGIVIACAHFFGDRLPKLFSTTILYTIYCRQRVNPRAVLRRPFHPDGHGAPGVAQGIWKAYPKCGPNCWRVRSVGHEDEPVRVQKRGSLASVEE